MSSDDRPALQERTNTDNTQADTPIAERVTALETIVEEQADRIAALET